MTLSRRTVMAGAAALPLANIACAAGEVTVHVDSGKSLGRIPDDFMGLGFEISSVAVPGLLSASNHAYVRLVRDLGRQGVIRIGGNTSDFATYDAHGTSVSAPKGTVVNESNLRELKTFVDATGWKLIWGLNLGDDKLDNAVAEARAVSGIMGDELLALEIGNEPDLFPAPAIAGPITAIPPGLPITGATKQRSAPFCRMLPSPGRTSPGPPTGWSSSRATNTTSRF